MLLWHLLNERYYALINKLIVCYLNGIEDEATGFAIFLLPSIYFSHVRNIIVPLFTFSDLYGGYIYLALTM